MMETTPNELHLPCKTIRPHYNYTDAFLLVRGGIYTKSEPLCSSATGAPGYSVESQQSRGGSVADGPEDVIG